MIDWRNLIAAGRVLVAPSGAGVGPLEESLRRAVSTSYYAMFHALAASNADCLLGTPANSNLRQDWNRLYRGMDHGSARRNLQRDTSGFSLATQNFIETFAVLQDARHRADYDPDAAISPQQAIRWIDTAEEAIEGFLSTSIEERKAVAVRALIRERSN